MKTALIEQGKQYYSAQHIEPQHPLKEGKEAYKPDTKPESFLEAELRVQESLRDLAICGQSTITWETRVNMLKMDPARAISYQDGWEKLFFKAQERAETEKTWFHTTLEETINPSKVEPSEGDAASSAADKTQAIPITQEAKKIKTNTLGAAMEVYKEPIEAYSEKRKSKDLVRFALQEEHEQDLAPCLMYPA